MCLKTVTWQAKDKKNWKQPKEWKIGYKVFKCIKPYQDSEETKIVFPYFNENEFKRNEILKARSLPISRMLNGCSESYMSGFHIFTTSVAASLYLPKLRVADYIFVKVKYRKVSAIGTHEIYTQYPTDCIVAQEMRILEEITEPIQEPEVRTDNPVSSKKRKRR